jgi:cytochrome P450
MKRFENVAAEAIVERLAIAAIHRGSDDSARVELLHLLRSILYRISATLVGIDNVADESRFQTYQQCMDELIKAAHAEWLEEDHQVALDRALAFKRLFSDEFFQPSWRRRERQIRQQTEAASGAEPTLDLISLMIANRDAFEQWDPDVFLRETILFHDGAIHTIANAVPHTITELAAWMPKHAQHESAREDPAFLRLVCNETLRLHPPAPFLIRKAVRDTTLPSGLFFRGGDYVVLDMIVASRDTEAFGDNPNNFDPFRHRSPDVKPVGIAFGDGPHSCIGITLSIGQTNASDEGDIEGIMIRILRALYRAGIVPDPDEPAAKDPATARDEYAKFPVVFTNPLSNS